MRCLLLLSGLILLSLAAGAREVDQQRPADHNARVVVEIAQGDVVIRGWDRPVIAVQGELDGDARRIELSGSRARPHLEVIHGDPGDPDGDADLEIMVPAGCRLNVVTTTGDLWIEGCTGAVSVRSASGEVEFGSAPRSVSLDLVSGDVYLDVPADSVDVVTVGGDIDVHGVLSSVRASTFGGDVTITTTAATSTLAAETLAGDVLIRGGVGPAPSWTVNAQSGDAVLSLDGPLDAAVSLTSLVGDVVFGIPGLKDRTRTRDGMVETLTGTLGDGRGSIEVQVMSGDVVVGRRERVE